MRKAIFIVLTLLIGVAGIYFASTEVSAANKADFKPGNIIDDFVFYNSQSMDENQIQSFLNSKNPNCDYNGTQSAADWGYPNITHAKLAEYKRNGTNGFKQDSGFHAPPYKCLTMYTQNTPQREAASGLCDAIPAYTNRSAAQIIKDVATACNINPQVLIILLEKEQSLITDNWPLNRQLEKATGFGCPDGPGATCDPSFGGFFYQVYYAARQFKVYQAYPNNYNYRAGRNNTIKWNPEDSCGTSTVYIENQATAALYIYTPYRPNQAALDNLYGSGDGCSAYGNRNFWRIFTDWFGTTRSYALIPELSARYNELNGVNGSLGIVSDNGFCNAQRTACWQGFKNGYLVWSQATGAWESKGSIRERWAQLGYQSGVLGYPVGPENYDASKGVWWQAFQNGALMGNGTSGFWESTGPTRDRWAQLGYQSGVLGYPIGKLETAPNGTAAWQQYQNGYLVWSQATGAWESKGSIRERWAQLGYQSGVLGYPVGPENYDATTATWSQKFEGGTITHTAGSTTYQLN